MKKQYKGIALATLAGLMVGGATLTEPWTATAFAQQQEQAAAGWRTYDDGAMTIQWKVEEAGGDKTVLLVFLSKSTKAFSLGWVDNPQFLLTTDQGTFPTKEMAPPLTNFNRKFDSSPLRLELTFRDAPGTVKALRITDIRPLNENHLPEAKGGIIDLTIDLQG